jgi:c-di-AMP phosphodiesterase-like protein
MFKIEMSKNANPISDVSTISEAHRTKNKMLLHSLNSYTESTASSDATLTVPFVNT